MAQLKSQVATTAKAQRENSAAKSIILEHLTQSKLTPRSVTFWVSSQARKHGLQEVCPYDHYSAA